VFARLAVDSNGATKTELTRIYPHFPTTVTMTFMGVDVPQGMQSNTPRWLLSSAFPIIPYAQSGGE